MTGSKEICFFSVFNNIFVHNVMYVQNKFDHCNTLDVEPMDTLYHTRVFQNWNVRSQYTFYCVCSNRLWFFGTGLQAVSKSMKNLKVCKVCSKTSFEAKDPLSFWPTAIWPGLQKADCFCFNHQKIRSYPIYKEASYLFFKDLSSSHFLLRSNRGHEKDCILKWWKLEQKMKRY